jgi:Zn-dependent M28 family amino/carboxypeptidase
MTVTLKTTFSFLLFFLSFNSWSQNLDSVALLQDLEYLSSDLLIGRKTGSKGNVEAKEYLIHHFTQLGLEKHYPNYEQKFSFENRREAKTYENAINVVGFVAGRTHRKLIVVTAHYDHVGIDHRNASGDSIYNGADDNASGTAALMALASYFSENRPEHSILFAALDAEEMGLQGAKALVRDFPFALDQILVNINMDMISRNDKSEIYASGTYHNPLLKPILERVSQGSYPILKFGHDIPGTGSDDWTQSSDHGAFFEKGVAHIYFGVEDHQDYHQPSDEFSRIQPRFYVAAANLILKSIIALDKELGKE